MIGLNHNLTIYNYRFLNCWANLEGIAELGWLTIDRRTEQQTFLLLIAKVEFGVRLEPLTIPMYDHHTFKCNNQLWQASFFSIIDNWCH